MSDNELGRRRESFADGADWTSTQLGRVSATTGMVAENLLAAPPVRAAAGATSAVTGVGAWAMSLLEQLARPNVGKAYTDGPLGAITGAMGNAYPPLAPVMNELGEKAKELPPYQDMQNKINNRVNSLPGGSK